MSENPLPLALGRVLISAAAADGQLGPAEIEALRDLLFRLPDLREEDWEQLQAELRNPPNLRDRHDRPVCQNTPAHGVPVHPPGPHPPEIPRLCRSPPTARRPHLRRPHPSATPAGHRPPVCRVPVPPSYLLALGQGPLGAVEAPRHLRRPHPPATPVGPIAACHPRRPPS